MPNSVKLDNISGLKKVYLLKNQDLVLTLPKDLIIHYECAGIKLLSVEDSGKFKIYFFSQDNDYNFGLTRLSLGEISCNQGRLRIFSTSKLQGNKLVTTCVDPINREVEISPGSVLEIVTFGEQDWDVDTFESEHGMRLHQVDKVVIDTEVLAMPKSIYPFQKFSNKETHYWFKYDSASVIKSASLEVGEHCGGCISFNSFSEYRVIPIVVSIKNVSSKVKFDIAKATPPCLYYKELKLIKISENDFGSVH